MAFLDIATPDFKFFLPASIASLALSFLLFTSIDNRETHIYIKSSSTFSKMGIYKFFTNNLLGSALIILFLLFAGYLPYAISEMRFGNERQLLYVRTSVVFAAFIVVSALYRKLENPKKLPKSTTYILCFIATSLLIQEKMKVADNYRVQSEYVQNFLGEIAQKIPTINEDQKLFIHLENPEFLRKFKKAFVLINRPQYPLSFIYQVNARTLDVTTITGYKLHQLKRNNEIQEGGFAKFLGVNFEKDIFISYHSENGVTPAIQIEAKWRKESFKLSNLPGLQNLTPASKEPSGRQSWYIERLKK